MKYDFAAIEKKWQKNWEASKPYAAVTGEKDKPKFYGLIEFPYPSGQGLHVGHPRPFTAMDVVTRKKRMEGYNVLFPIGFDAFGLPTENYAIKNHIHPAIVTKKNIENFTSQLKMLGYGFDWDRCVDTTDPAYYKWTQWIFLQLYKHGLAYKATMPVNWCTSCKCVLANEEVVDGVCERCGSPVVRKEKSQWMLAITKYAERLLNDLDDVDYIERVKIQQRNWIG
ncbi:MAG: class I tRNA ligase family protein, partial [Oscillospiraceae bacterium]|nr:class I tRNA ligase family protein [Oscillospiraceae bacterium]